MSFTIRLGSEAVVAEAGATTPVAIHIENRSSTPDQFELDIEGIDPEWKALPVPVVNCGANETCSERFFFRPPRASESLAGNYPFVVKVRSLESGETRTVQGVLEIRPFHHLSMEIDPKRGVVTATRTQNVFGVSLVNLGNTPHTVRLQANDPEDDLAFEFDQEQVTVGPGQQKQVEARAVPTSTRMISSGRLIGFTVSARSLDVPTVVATSQAQLEQRSLFSPASLVGVLLFGIVALLWFLNMPKPPTVLAFDVEPVEVEMGQPVKLTWQVAEDSQIRIQADGELVTEESGRSGEFVYTTPADAGRERITFELVAERNGKKSDPARSTLRLRPKEIVDPPKIVRLSPSTERVRLGESFVLSYKFNESTTKAILSPDNTTLDPALPSISLTPKTAGKQTYTVTAYNKAGTTVNRTFEVSVVEESDAKILSLVASPNPVPYDQNRVALTWSVLKAVRIQLKANGQLLNIDETATSGTIEAPISGKTTFTLTAYDENGRATSQNQVVNVQAPPKPEPEEPPIDAPPVLPDGSPADPDGFPKTP